MSKIKKLQGIPKTEFDDVQCMRCTRRRSRLQKIDGMVLCVSCASDYLDAKSIFKNKNGEKRK